MDVQPLDRQEEPVLLVVHRTTRRDAVKVGAAIAVGVTAAAYVKPSLRSLGVPAALALSSRVAQGCSPGFYKSGHQGSPYVPNQSFFTTFGLPSGACGLPSSYSLQNAIDNSGGEPVQLARQGAAAYVNSIRGIGYPLSTAQVISQVNAAFQGCDVSKMDALQTTLDGYNNIEGAAC